jgi:acetate kinase
MMLLVSNAGSSSLKVCGDELGDCEPRLQFRGLQEGAVPSLSSVD